MSLRTNIGGKALRLVQMREAGMPVPPFVAFDGERIARASKEESWTALAEEAVMAVKAKRYAIRSSGSAEDAADASLAGAFTTEVDVPADGVAAAMAHVADDASKKLKGHLEGFGIIVQEFVEPDFAGVAFTRHPAGGREMVVEWCKGRGDQLVSGRVNPERIAFYRTGVLPHVSLPGFEVARNLFFEIETLFGAPQDIEWCIAGGKWWIVQSRPITTRTALMNEMDTELDRVLPKGDFIFEKTGVSEIAPRPCQQTLDLLRFVHAAGGPIDLAYRRLGISYADMDALRIVGNELYVDRDAEIRSLFPSYGCVGRPRYAPGSVRLNGFWRSLQNTMKFSTMVVPDPSIVAERIATFLTPPKTSISMKEAMGDLTEQYQELFIANVYAEKTVAELKTLAAPWGGSMAALLTGSCGVAESLKPPPGLVGNGFDVADRSEFRWSPDHADDSTAERECARAPAALQEKVRTVAARARAYARLRECGRWLTVKLATQLRSAMKDEPTLEKVRFTFPSRLTGKVEAQTSGDIIGVSAGVAEGMVVSRDGLSNAKAPTILVVVDLTPDLVDLFDSIEGIIAQKGGLLSHCAIVARERGIPIVVGGDPVEYLGKKIKIDGGAGTVTGIS